jgi:hypothetical protein
MFQSISWIEFLTLTGVLVVGYYAISVPVLFAEEIKAILNNGFPKRKVASDAGVDLAASNSLMGETRGQRGHKHDENVNAASDELVFAPMTKPGEDVEVSETREKTQNDSLLVGSVSDLGQEINALSKKTASLSKAEIATKFSQLLAKYSKVGTSRYRSTITLLIIETLQENNSLVVSGQEVDSWWSK